MARQSHDRERKRFVGIEEVGPFARAIMRVDEINKPLDYSGAKSYEIHACMNMNQARKSIAVRRIIARLGVGK